MTAFILFAFCLAATVLFVAPTRADEGSPTQVALVGCAHIHTPDFVNRLKQRKDIKVVAVWDHDPERAKRNGQELGAPVVENLNQIWSDKQIRAVIICSETVRHLELVTAAAKAKKHIYAEKPLGIGAEDAREMADQISENHVLFQTGYFMRGDPKLQFLKEQIAKGSFGKITRIRGCNAHEGALGGWFDKDWRWMADPKRSGVGAYGDLGTHSLDLMLWLMNESGVTRVTAATSMGTRRYEGCDELGEGILLFQNGAIGTLAAGWDDISNPVSLEIAGTEGHATIMNGQLYFQSHLLGVDGKRPWTELPSGQPHPFERFLDAIAGKPDVTLIPPDEAAYRSEVMDALYQAAKGQKWVDLAPRFGNGGRRQSKTP